MIFRCEKRGHAFEYNGERELTLWDCVNCGHQNEL
jgi:hypothetical protein